MSNTKKAIITILVLSGLGAVLSYFGTKRMESLYNG